MLSKFMLALVDFFVSTTKVVKWGQKFR